MQKQNVQNEWNRGPRAGILELGEFEVSRVLVLFTEEIKHHRIGFTVKVFNLE